MGRWAARDSHAREGEHDNLMVRECGSRQTKRTLRQAFALAEKRTCMTVLILCSMSTNTPPACCGPAWFIDPMLTHVQYMKNVKTFRSFDSSSPAALTVVELEPFDRIRLATLLVFEM